MVIRLSQVTSTKSTLYSSSIIQLTRQVAKVITEHKDTKPHKIIIHQIDDKQGIDYTVIHNDECKKVDWVTDPFGNVIQEYECLLQYIIDGIGITEVFKDHLEKEPSLGELQVIGCSNYDDYNRESDMWIEIYDEAKKFRTELEWLADIHHRTMTGSKFHNPEAISSFKDCPCLTCIRITKVLENASSSSN